MTISIPKNYLFNNNITNAIYKLHSEGKTKKQICDKLQMTYSQVNYFYRIHKLRKHFWLTSLDKQFIANNKNLTNKEIALILNRSENTISRHRKHNHYLSQSEKNFIFDNPTLSNYKIGKILNRSRTHIKTLKTSI